MGLGLVIVGARLFGGLGQTCLPDQRAGHEVIRCFSPGGITVLGYLGKVPLGGVVIKRIEFRGGLLICPVLLQPGGRTRRDIVGRLLAAGAISKNLVLCMYPVDYARIAWTVSACTI